MLPLSAPRDADITFADPGDTTSFTETLRDLSRASGQPSPAELARMQVEAPAQFAVGFRAAERQMRLVDSFNARDNALAEAAAHRIRTVRDITGVELENPFDGGYAAEAARRVRAMRAAGEDVSEFDNDPLSTKMRLRIFNEKMAEAVPDRAAALDFGQPLEDQAKALARGAAFDAEHAEGGWPAAIAGGLWGLRRDPLFLTSLFVGPGLSQAGTTLARLGWSAVNQGLTNMGLMAIEQPAVQAWRREIGERSGVVPALENVGLAFVFGAIPGAAMQGVKELATPARSAIERISTGVPQAGDVAEAARRLGVTLDDATARAVAAAEADTPQAAAAIGAPPPGVPAAEHAEIAAQAVRFAEDPANNPPPEIPLIAPERPADQARVVDEALPAAPGDRTEVDGKPVAFHRFDPAELSTDAAAFQYKGGGDASGVTNRLKNVTTWDPVASGKVLVFERADGTRVIADGHQRLGLAKRLAGPRFRGHPLPDRGVAPANLARDGTIYVGPKNGLHFDIEAPPELRAGLKPGEYTWADTGFVTPDGKFLDREAALAWVNANEKKMRPADNMGVELDAADYREQVPHALRSTAQPPPSADIRLDGFLFREADGWTPADVRALAAKKNMQESSGDALDAARVLRDRPDLLDGSLPVTSPMMKNAVYLSHLSDEAFGMALNDVVPANYAAAVGAMVHDKLKHASILADLVRFKPESEREARVLIGEIVSAGFRTEEQISLFGETVATKSLMGQRVKVLDAALAGLVKDKRLFGTLAEKADAIEAAGNRLARQTNTARARDAAQLSDMLSRLARRTGPVSDALNRAAASMAEGTPRAKAAGAFLDEVRELLDRDGLVGLLQPPELKPALVVEPGTKEAAAAAETAIAERTGLAGEISAPVAPDPAEIGKASPRSPKSQEGAIDAVDDFTSGQAGVSVEQLHLRAQALQAEIATAGKAAADESGALFVNPGFKLPERLAEKIARKGYDDASQITDAARGGMIVETPAQADAAVAALSRHFDVIDEGWKTNAVGYIDRKVLVRGADGTVGEIQIIPSRMFEAKKGGGQKLYTQARSMQRSPERTALEDQQRELYSAASARFGAEWSGIFETSSGPNLPSNVRRQASSDMTPDVSATSSSSTGTQGAPGLSTANANRSGVSTAGRQSQLQNVSIDESVRSDLLVGKPAEPDLFGSIAVAERADGRDVRLVSRAAALEDADRPTFHADLVNACKE